MHYEWRMAQKLKDEYKEPVKEKKVEVMINPFKSISDYIQNNLKITRSHAAAGGILAGLFFQTYLLAAFVGGCIFMLWYSNNKE